MSLTMQVEETLLSKGCEFKPWFNVQNSVLSTGINLLSI